MKVYELIEKLSNLHAGSEVEVIFEKGSAENNPIIEVQETGSYEDIAFIILKGKK